MLRRSRKSRIRSRISLAAGFLIAMVLWIVLVGVEVLNANRGIAEQRSTGLAAMSVGGSPVGILMSAAVRGAYNARMRGMAYYQSGAVYDRSAQAAEMGTSEHEIVRTASLRLIATRPAEAAAQVARLAASLGGFVLTSSVSGSDNDQTAELSVRVPADRLDDLRDKVRSLAQEVLQDLVEAQDVTRDVVDRQAGLRNLHATEAQYLGILRRATRVEDVVAVTAKLAEIRGQIERQDAELRTLYHQVALSLLRVQVITPPQTTAPYRWRPWQQTRDALHNAMVALAEYGDTMVALLFRLPIYAIWTLTVLALIKLAWVVLRRLLRALFPDLPFWAKQSAQAG